MRAGLFLVGDPLMVVNMPKAGFDVFGPVERLELIDPAAPLAILPTTTLQFDLAPASQPSAGEDAAYFVQKVDSLGRHQGAGRSLHTTKVNDEPSQPALEPMWPTGADWPVRLEGGDALPMVMWEQSMTSARVASIDLEAQIDANPTQILATLVPTVGQRLASFSRTLDQSSVRFRFAVTSLDGATSVTPWSMTVAPTEATLPALQLFES